MNKKPWVHFQEEHGEIVYRERLSPWVRVFVAMMALAMLVIPVAFAWSGSWNEWSIGMLLAIVAVVAPVLLSLVFLAIALASTRQLRFDTALRTVHFIAQGPLGRRQHQIRYGLVEAIDVRKRQGMDDPDYFVIGFRIAGRRAMELGSFATREEAERWQQRLRDEVGHEADSRAIEELPSAGSV